MWGPVRGKFCSRAPVWKVAFPRNRGLGDICRPGTRSSDAAGPTVSWAVMVKGRQPPRQSLSLGELSWDWRSRDHRPLAATAERNDIVRMRRPGVLRRRCYVVLLLFLLENEDCCSDDKKGDNNTDNSDRYHNMNRHATWKKMIICWWWRCVILLVWNAALPSVALGR